jgi:hypothetical protein
MNTIFEPEAFSEEMEDFLKAQIENANSIERWMIFGFDVSTATQFAAEESKHECPIEDLLKFFGCEPITH